MKLSQQSLSTIESAIQKAAGKYVCGCDQTAVTDIHLQPDKHQDNSLFITTMTRNWLM